MTNTLKNIIKIVCYISTASEATSGLKVTSKPLHFALKIVHDNCGHHLLSLYEK